MEQQVNWKKMYLTMAAAAEDALALLPPEPERLPPPAVPWSGDCWPLRRSTSPLVRIEGGGEVSFSVSR